MSRFRNETGGVLTVNDLSARVGPGEEFDWPDHDPEVHGLIPGCIWLDAPPEAAAGDAETGADGQDDGPAADGQRAVAAASTSRKRKGAGDEGKENPE